MRCLSMAGKARDFVLAHPSTNTGQLAVVGIGAYRTGFGRPDAVVGPQEALLAESLGETRVWVLPNPSGLNAHWPAAALAEEFGRLREAAQVT